MPAARRNAAPARLRAATAQNAARAEANGRPREIEYRGAKFTVPAKMPAETLFIMAEEDPADPWAELRSSLALLRSVLGDEQMDRARSVMRSEAWDVDDFAGFAELVVSQYGTTEGESEASQPS